MTDSSDYKNFKKIYILSDARPCTRQFFLLALQKNFLIYGVICGAKSAGSNRKESPCALLIDEVFFHFGRGFNPDVVIILF